MKTLYITTVLSLMLLSCDQQSITDASDYNSYLISTKTDQLDAVYKKNDFWNSRITTDSTQIVALAAAGNSYTNLFNRTGDINALKKAEKALKKAADKAAISKDSYLLALAQNYITQHQFKKAHQTLLNAQEIGGKRKATAMLLFDVSMELGLVEKAEQYLDQIENYGDFDYLIRLAKWSDHQGNLAATISYMERAKLYAEASKKQDLLIWTYTNLGDYYSHDGQLDRAYDYFLRTLALDDQNTYAKKRIAWITYSHEHNPSEAQRILASIKNQSPDLLLFRADLAESLSASAEAKQLRKEFVTTVDKPEYGSMYDAYLANLYAENFKDYDTALHYAEKDVAARPTAETYGLLAHIYHLKGDTKKALKIAEAHVKDKTEEPLAAYYLAQIYIASGNVDQAQSYKDDLLASSFELGPAMARNIKKLYL
ncbi:hypothetical protein GCM10009117_24150 [Gangjinia marincola]|uniref:Tetratricopeptide repeat protein n=1 Tax=Gangjinia marincola TaxID=578463 RepID=A0ABN1MK73_9FLAO